MLQTSPIRHIVPHAPQLSKLACVSMQSPSQRISPAAH
jgi:hypothetical protein